MNIDAKASLVCITGMMGTGKTGKAVELWLKSKAKWKLGFDPQCELSQRLGVRPCTQLEQMVAAVKAGQPMLLDPSQMFSGEPLEAITFFCRWAFNICQVLDGPKLIVIDEFQRYITRRNVVPKPMNEVFDLCRRAEIHLVIVCNKGLHTLHDDVLSQMTELYVFKQISPRAAKVLRDQGIEEYDRVKDFRLPDRKKNIPPEFIHRCI